MYNQTSLVDLCHHENFTYHYGDVREWSKLKYLVEQVDVVIPLAALVGFPLCEKDKDLATSINSTQIQNIVDIFNRTGLRALERAQQQARKEIEKKKKSTPMEKKELDEFLQHDFIPRFGGGIGVTRMISAMKKAELI